MNARAHNRGLSAEIRVRLQAGISYLKRPGTSELDHSKTSELHHPKTSELAVLIEELDRKIFATFGRRWLEHPYTLAVFKAGVAEFLSRYHPDGDESTLPDAGIIGEPRDPPDVVGRTYARLILVDRYGLSAGSERT